MILVATSEGLIGGRLGTDGGWEGRSLGLTDVGLSSVIAREGVILAGSESGIFRSEDLGASWQPASRGLTSPHVRWLAFHPDVSDREFAGTEPAGIFLSTDGGDTWRARPEVDALRDRHGWFLPYSPEAGCVRGFAFSGRRGYAAVEVGGVLRSDDAGATWSLAPGSDGRPEFEHALQAGAAPADVHDVRVHPSDPDLVFIASHAGLFRSRDGGGRWQRLSADVYCRALWVDPADADHIIFGPASRRGWDGSIAETWDGGEQWRSVTDGIPEPWRGRPVERFAAVGSDLWAIRDDGRCFVAPLDTLQWRVLPLRGVRAVTEMV